VAREYIEDAKHKEDLDRAARDGKSPPAPPPPADSYQEIRGNRYPVFDTPKGKFTYSWVELDREERQQLGLDNAAENDPNRGGFWKQVAQARAEGKPLLLSQLGGFLIYSRNCEERKMPPDQRAKKKYEYFVLTRDPERDPET